MPLESIKDNESGGQEDPGLRSLEALKDKFDPDKARRLRTEYLESDNSEKTIQNLKDFYDAIDNPIDDDATLISIIGAFADAQSEPARGATLPGAVSKFYECLQEIGIDDKESGITDPEDHRRFEEKMFNRWRHSVADMPKEVFQQSRDAGILGNDFKALRSFLKAHPECVTTSGLWSAITKAYDGEDLGDMLHVLEKYSWKKERPEWTHVLSRRVNAKQEREFPVEHRLYLNTDSSSTYAAVDALVDYYEKKQMPYYFKFNDKGKRADTIVIYTSTKDLINNFNLLRQLKKERPDLAEHFHKPPILTSVIDKNIGYGAEPPEKSSYSNVRANMIESVLKDVNESATIDWVAKHQNDTISIGGKKMLFSEYVVEKRIETLKNDLKEKREEELNKQRRRYGVVNEEEISRQMGFDEQDLQDDSKMFRLVRKKLNDSFPDIIKSLQDGENFKLPIKKRENSKEIQLSSRGSLLRTLSVLTSKIVLNDKSFLDDIKKRIHEKCIKEGIDPDKFAFDIATVEKMKKQNRIDTKS